MPAVSTQYCVHFWVFGSKVLKLFPAYPGLVQFSKITQPSRMRSM